MKTEDSNEQIKYNGEHTEPYKLDDFRLLRS